MRLLLGLSIVGVLTQHAFGAGSEAIIKQRAKELSNQNNVRQGVAPPVAQPVQRATVATPAPPTPAGKLQLDLAAIKPNTPVTTAQKQQITADIINLAQGGKKPSHSAASKLAQDMVAALSQKTPSEASRARLVQNLKAALNPGTLPAAQMTDIVADVQAVFQSSGIPRKDAVVIAEDLKAIVAELQGAAK
jgi:hypothetical protein